MIANSNLLCRMEKNLYIKQASETTGLSAPNIRYYEKEGLIKNLARNEVGERIFTDAEIDWILFLKKLRDMDVPIAKMREYANLREQGNPTATARKKILEEHRKIMFEKIVLINEQIKLLDDKIIYYETLENNENGVVK